MSSLGQRLLPAWVYKTEECAICLSFFSTDMPPGPDPRTGLDPKFKPDRRLLEPEYESRCHGCWVARFTISFFSHILEDVDSENMRDALFYLDANVDGTNVVLTARKGRSRGGYVLSKLQLLKTTLPPAQGYMESWLRYVISFLNPNAYNRLPVYVAHAYESPPIVGHTGSQDAFKKIFTWFDDCVAHHPDCGSGLSIHPMPTRLIDISDRDNMLLVEGVTKRSHYIALSHRWIEASKMPRCVSSNIGSLKTNVPWSFLTRNFQDTIVFIKDFASWYAKGHPHEEPIRYVWIDSLCIVQDSVADWDAESKLMCSVYEGALLTVAAAAGPDGCFAEAERVYKGFDVTNPHRQNPRLLLRKRLPDHENECEMAEREHVIQQKSLRPPSRLDLMTRGWVMQERLLSRRFVVFAPNEVMWECYEGSQCECGRLSSMTGQLNLKGEEGVMSQYNQASYRYYDSKRADDPNYSFLPMPLKMAYYASLDDKGEHAARNLRNWWRRLVERYTTLDLTQESDRLPAIMGLAIQYGRRTGQEMESYLAGIWRNSLPLDLLWHNGNPSMEPISEYSKNKGPPSWSWASCRGKVRMPREGSLSKLTYFAELTSVNVGVRIAVGMRCPVFTGLSKRTRDETFPIVVLDYAPDRATSLATSVWEDEAKFALISRAGEGDETTWMYLHIRPVHDFEGSGITYSRIGLLELAKRRCLRNKATCSDILLESCFKSGTVEEIELV
ncbi:hypothetical protein BDP55DRAFT_635951 [Colletotrichum godetiae]|uniref:Heterokaryon incompatibility domain-containing protein n=1 Tax=Colletotrichum godetiae TaxID=1209918 RepID=A0AAJ0ETJ4_9PEZI|nr:uncharacterized protein BDP55DRAFT_635951 [Colletotrichum godetiae]KAK1671304.1 hypothetical protein BDP55DRAFT_635951 [Colletotrichum godetiae]